MSAVRADARVQHGIEIVVQRDAACHAGRDIGEEQLAVDRKGDAVAGSVDMVADDSGAAFACAFASCLLFFGDILVFGVVQEFAWIGKQYFRVGSVVVDHAHP